MVEIGSNGGLLTPTLSDLAGRWTDGWAGHLMM